MPAWSKYYIREYHKIINIHGLKGTKNNPSLQLHLDRDITDGPLLWKICPYTVDRYCPYLTMRLQ